MLACLLVPTHEGPTVHPGHLGILTRTGLDLGWPVHIDHDREQTAPRQMVSPAATLYNPPSMLCGLSPIISDIHQS